MMSATHIIARSLNDIVGPPESCKMPNSSSSHSMGVIALLPKFFTLGAAIVQMVIGAEVYGCVEAFMTQNIFSCSPTTDSPPRHSICGWQTGQQAEQ